jgi:molecular chaperone DnaK
LAAITTATAELNKQWEAASADMYQASQQGQGETQTDGNTGSNNSAGSAEDVTDVDYEEVK